MPELCRRQLTLTCLDNDDVLPVTQLQHLTWCAALRSALSAVLVPALPGIRTRDETQHASAYPYDRLSLGLGSPVFRTRSLVLTACLHVLKNQLEIEASCSSCIIRTQN